MPPIEFEIDPKHIREWLEKGGKLRVLIHGDRHQYHKVSVAPA